MKPVCMQAVIWFNILAEGFDQQKYPENWETVVQNLSGKLKFLKAYTWIFLSAHTKLNTTVCQWSLDQK